MNNTPRVALSAGLLLVLAGVAGAQSQPTQSPMQFAALGDFKLQSGPTIPNFRLADPPSVHSATLPEAGK